MPRRRVIAVLLVVLAFSWILVNGPVEGPILLNLGNGHGVTVADLLSVAACILAGWLWVNS